MASIGCGNQLDVEDERGRHKDSDHCALEAR